MKIGELAKLSGLAASRIRFYEAQGLLPPAQRQSNGYREYDPQTLTRLEIINCAQGAGFSLEEIRAVLPPDLEAWPHAALLETIQRKIDEIELLERRLAQSKRHLRTLIDDITHKTEGEDCKVATRRVLDKLRQGATASAAAKPRTRAAGKRA
ncbi:MerR family transcriptional regulator [Pandoraea sp.]|uniref:MerR family transcriptional regulator n=1 Tax=Pandoraea sp. TaxID=1883445 RepID=UPI00121271E3|nr:MerR family transcriptional regulator [Pandoraea sp.]TAL54554.1 MAG: MerR family transcriptional regulator [Pandoraea sp.]TAM15746.1 MAG: MerR family transcriptional regulator [Pandoraea sp.]